jgi:undecaprenyl-diphosphatase
MGNYPMIPIGLGFVVWLWWTKHHREAVLVAIILAAATVGSESVKAIVARDRPSGPVPGIPGVVYSYPSGHALEDVMILGMLSVRLWRSKQAEWLKVGFAVVSALLCVLIGIARVALNVHYPSDILAGFLGGLTCLGWYAWGTREGAWASRPGTSLSGFHLARQP